MDVDLELRVGEEVATGADALVVDASHVDEETLPPRRPVQAQRTHERFRVGVDVALEGPGVRPRPGAHVAPELRPFLVLPAGPALVPCLCFLLA